MNPYSEDMMKAYHAYLALHALDENCEEYIKFMTSVGEPQKKAAVSEGNIQDRASKRGIVGFERPCGRAYRRAFKDG